MNKSIVGNGKRVKEYLDRLVAGQQVPGIQYIVVDAHSIRFQYAGGIRDAKNPKGDDAHQNQVTSQTLFSSASCTKVLTAAAVLKLVEAQKIDLDDPLSRYYDKHPYGDEILVRQLLNQTSGIPNPMPFWFHTSVEHSSFSESQALSETLQKHSKLDFSPGDKYAYSNLSYWLLGKVIEKASGMNYSEFMEKEIFNTLGISSDEMTCEPTHYNLQNNFARGHSDRFSILTLFFWMLLPSNWWAESCGKWARFQTLYMNGPSYGGVLGTAMGYAKFLQDMLRTEPKLFSDNQLFFQDQFDNHENRLPTTLGWHRGHLEGHIYYGKPGGGAGYHGNIRVYPDAGIATVYFSNKTEVTEGPINAFSDLLDSEFLKGEENNK